MLLVLLLTSTVVVSPNGPYQTPEEGLARAEVLLDMGAKNVNLRIEPGQYFLTQEIKLTAKDNNLHIEGVGRTVPELIGGKALNSWRPVRDATVLTRLTSEARANVLECDLEGDDALETTPGLSERGFGFPSRPSGVELFFNGKPMQLARYPNPDAPDGGWLRIASAPTQTAITYPGDEPSRWLNHNDIWAFGYWKFDWADSYEQVTDVDSASHTVTFANAHFKYPPAPGRRFYFLNVLEELDEPGEWYLDRTAHKLYFWPPSPVKKGSVIVSTLPGTMFQLDHTSHVEISGLDLEEGYSGGVSVRGGSDNWVRNCVVRNFGEFGISIDGAANSGVTGCDLTGLGEFGIALNGGDRKTLNPGNLVAEDNHIWAYSRWCRTYQPAIEMSGVGNRASHNWIHDAPHQAVLLSGNDHLIEFNEISDVCTETSDAGAVYMGRDTTMRGNVIQFNRFSNLSPKVSTSGNFTDVMGVYLDDCWAGTTIYGNIFDMRGTAVMIGGGRDNTVSNNVFLNCNPAIHFDARGKGWAAKYFAGWEFAQKMAFVNPTRPPYSTRYPKLANIQSVDFAFPAGNDIDSNVSLGGQWMRLLDNLTTKDFENVDDVVSPELGNYEAALRLAPKSFKPIPTSKIGVLSKRRPSSRLDSGS